VNLDPDTQNVKKFEEFKRDKLSQIVKRLSKKLNKTCFNSFFANL